MRPGALWAGVRRARTFPRGMQGPRPAFVGQNRGSREKSPCFFPSLSRNRVEREQSCRIAFALDSLVLFRGARPRVGRPVVESPSKKSLHQAAQAPAVLNEHIGLQALWQCGGTGVA